MKVKMKGALAALFLITAGLSLAEEAPVYSVVKAEKIRARAGIGNFMRKIRQGEEVVVAYLGGSITAANGWRPKTTAWLREQYPQATFKEVNAAIGGTGSDLGVFRLEHDALRHAPDLLFVEFAVNDGGASPESIWRGMEGIVRQTWRKNAATDIVFTYTVASGMTNDLIRGECPRSASAMEMLADFYGIPSVNFAVPVVDLMQAGKLVFTADAQPAGDVIWFAADSCHPRDAGHNIYRDLMAAALTQMAESQPVDHKSKLERTFVADNWEAAKMVPLTAGMLQGEWRMLGDDEGLQKNFGHRMGRLWMAEKPGSRLSFKFRGAVAQVYDIVGPDGGQVTVTVNGKALKKPLPRFDSYCTYHRIATLGLVSGANTGEVHEVAVEIHPEQPDRRSVSHRLKDPERELAAPKYQGTRVWMSSLLLLGDLVN
ncbi:MAG: SGNH/GDSL hydrolase family protein [Kiritimatiellae bacterium]|nr:SGNH/GDSL hydrolase family protein [Kiritimatiellia bacterium]